MICGITCYYHKTRGQGALVILKNKNPLNMKSYDFQNNIDSKYSDILIGQALRKKCPYSELFWSVFSRFRTEYGGIRIIEHFSHSEGLEAY